MEMSDRVKIANGSLAELDAQLEIALKLGHIASSQKAGIDSDIESVAAKLAGLLRNLRTRL